MLYMNLFEDFEAISMSLSIFSSIFCLFTLMMFLFFLSKEVFILKNNKFIVFSLFILNLFKIFLLQDKMNSLKFSPVILSFLFMIFLILNLLSLISMSVSLTTQIFLLMMIALIFWSTMFFSSMIFSMKLFLKNLMPKGVILFLGPLMVLIESVSQISRPFTLSIRLTANMTAGHVLLGLILLMFFSVSFFSKIVSLFLFIIWVSYLLVEFAISAIQSGIFTVLNSVYLNEHV